MAMTPAEQAAKFRKKPVVIARMDAYYYGFERTGVEAIERGVTKKMPKGYHKRTKHYWLHGKLVKAPKGIAGEPCEQCWPIRARAKESEG